jgi:hypothetical protein
MAENPRAKATSPENPTPNFDSSDLGRFKSIEAKERSLGNLKPPFKAGHPALPGAGRPRGDGPVTKELRKILRSNFPNDPQGRTYLRLVVEGLVKAAIRGNTFAAEILLERMDGKVPYPTEADLPATITVVVNRNVSRADCDLLKEGLVLEGTVEQKSVTDVV